MYSPSEVRMASRASSLAFSRMRSRQVSGVFVVEHLGIDGDFERALAPVADAAGHVVLGQVVGDRLVDGLVDHPPDQVARAAGLRGSAAARV